MKTLNLEKLWEAINRISNKQDELAESENSYVSLLGYRSNYFERSFDSFLENYSFKISGIEIIVFNDDGISWESSTTEDFSHIPICILEFDEKELDDWIKTEIESQLKTQELEKVQEQENIKSEIERLQKRLNS